MSNYNGDSYTDLRNINLRGGASGTGLIRWDPASIYSNNGALWSSNPFTTTDYGLYINSDGNLVYSSKGTTVVLGAAGAPGGGASTWDAIYQNDQTLAISGNTLTFDGTHATNNVVTITDSANGTGILLQITNTGSGSDISGTSASWSFSKTGVATMLTATLAGSAGATSLELTLGNILIDAGGIAMTKAANNATFSITNATISTAVASTWTFAGLTTGGALLLTSAGTLTTTGYMLTVTANAATTAAGLIRLNANGLTSGIGLVIASSATAITGAGRLLYINHTGTTSTSGTLVEVASAAADGTVIQKITASGILTGTVLSLVASSMTTGIGISVSIAGLTTGQGISVTSASTGVTTTGRLLYVYHSGATSTTGTIAEMRTDSTDTTVLLKLTTAASVSGVNLSIVGTTGMTTGSLIRATSSTAAAVATNGIYSFLLTGAYTSGASTVGAFHVAGAATVSGTIMSILGGAQTTGIALNITDPSTGMTSGSLLRVISATTGAVATNGVVSFQLSGAYTSSAATLGAVHVSATATVSGTALSVLTGSMTTGVGFYVSDGAGTGLTSGSLVRVVTATTGAVATNGVVSIQASGAFTSTSNVGLLDVGATASIAGTVAHFWNSSAQTTGQILNVTQTGATTTYTGNVVQITGSATTGQANTLAVIGVHTTLGNVVSITNASAIQTGSILLNVAQSGTTTGYTGAVVSVTGSHTTGGQTVLVTDVTTTTGDAVKIVNNALAAGTSTALNIVHGTTVLGAGNSLLRITSTGADTGTTTGTLLDLASNTTTAATLVLVTATALATGIGMSLALAGITTGTGLQIAATAATLTGAGRYLALYDGAAQVFSIGANGHIHTVQTAIPTIGTNATGISAVALTAGASDVCGQFTTTGTPQSGTVLTLTFNKTYTNPPKTVILMPLNASAGNPNTVPYISSITATTFVLTWPAGGVYAATPSYAYLVIA